MRQFILQEMRKPYGALIPWGGLLFILLLVLWVVRSFGIESVEQERTKLEVDWAQARKAYQYHQEGLRAKKDLAQVWGALLEERDFAPLALGITEEAKQRQVALPSLSYKKEATVVSEISKGMLEGTLSGRYEDLRRFLFDIETAEELVYIEDLALVQSSSSQGQPLTFNVTIGTYLRGDGGKPVNQ